MLERRIVAKHGPQNPSCVQLLQGDAMIARPKRVLSLK